MLAAELDWPNLVPVGALLFTVASFWWIYLRRGRLKLTTPDTFASSLTAGKVRLRFPLVIFNTGAASIVVGNLRLVVEGHELEWISVRRSVRTFEDDFLDFAAPFAIAGREALRVIAEFGDDRSPWLPELDRSYRVRIDRKVADRWKALGEFDWWTPTKDEAPCIAHRNRPHRPADTSS